MVLPAQRMLVSALGRLELGDDRRKSLGQCVVEPTRNTRSLVMHPRLSGLGEELRMQRRILPQSVFQFAVCRLQRCQSLLALLVLLLADQGEPRAGASDKD